MVGLDVGFEAGGISPEISPAWAVYTAGWNWSPHLWRRGITGVVHCAALEFMDGGVEPNSCLVEGAKLPAGCTASLDAISTVALRVVAWMASTFGVDALPDGLLVGELEHGFSWAG